ncbi:profilin [Spirillospora sp. NPDC050679]
MTGLLAGAGLLVALAAPADAAAAPPAREGAPIASAPQAEARRAPDWHAITDSMVASGALSQAAIITRDGAHNLAQTGGLYISERQTLSRAFDYPGSYLNDVITIAGRRWYVLQSDAKTMAAEAPNKIYFWAEPTAQTIVVAVYDANKTKPLAAKAELGKAATSIRNQGY